MGFFTSSRGRKAIATKQRQMQSASKMTSTLWKTAKTLRIGTVEKAFAKFEGEASAVLDEIIAAGTIPNDADKFITLMNFIAFSAARIPAMRAVITKPSEEIAEMILHMNLSSEEQFKYSYKQAGIDVDAIGLTYEKAKQIAAELTIRTTTAAYIHHLNTVVNIMLPLLADRHWCVLHNDGANANLIVTDNPVGITWSDAPSSGKSFRHSRVWQDANGRVNSDWVTHRASRPLHGTAARHAGNGCAGCGFDEHKNACWAVSDS